MTTGLKARFAMANHALIFGATGIQGWAIVKQLLNDYPSADAFDRVTALSNRPVPENVLWPASGKLHMTSGIDLLTDDGQEGLEKNFKANIANIDSVSHVFFCGKTCLACAEPLILTENSIHLQRRSR